MSERAGGGAGGESTPDQEFLERLDAVEAALDRVEVLQRQVVDLETGLDQQDTERLLYGRMSGWSLADVRSAFDALEDVENGDERVLLVRLLADLGDLTQNEARQILDEIDRLQHKYSDGRTDREIEQ